MSAFSEYLERLKNEQDLSIVQIGNMANVDSSTLFRWMSGQSLPDSWERVERVLDCMQCTVSDKANIKMLFEKTSIGEKKWRSIKEIFKLIINHSRKNIFIHWVFKKHVFKIFTLCPSLCVMKHNYNQSKPYQNQFHYDFYTCY